ncbi:deoxyguanosinetriphosphate triphosphohydrolase [Pelistega suis]|uniref:Deoxyguanosinetriphosphate triphosphohydrolase-like protein n=1 Tax=Pelistega suis TaxID=1631957 RepID=A0A849P245_9BURK|nr:deoxyguanosinetriphosphate triphosphohydrolase [Pelistega suis]MCQ9327930.1 deoxyguanosinetriphosphate triphosphohydrolase [Pelistega suis]NOL50711.1 deoxyguanosinetriphosphate triphosphohydrolase [Pelistega suis]
MALASYASLNEATKGRVHFEQEDPKRSPYQRDRDRIIHCGAFRRLEYKTQVFVNHEGDLFRTRLTHSLEVAQIGRAIARNLSLNEDLVEAIALAHDLGHTPFGHAGQDALNECMRDYAPEIGGFEHNLQSLRIVDELEERYASFNGLNLCFETRAGILKHCSARNARQLGEVAQRFLDRQQPSLEAQLTNLADGIAYNNHDIDDGLRSGLITLEQMREIPIFNEHYESVMWLYPEVKGRRVISETIRRMINTLIVDLTQTTLANIRDHHIKTIEDVHQAPMLVSFSPEIKEQEEVLKKFLMDNLYRHYKVMRMTAKATMIIRDLFKAFLEEPRLLPTDYQFDDDKRQQQAIADYIAGMTDRFAMREHRQLFEV